MRLIADGICPKAAFDPGHSHQHVRIDAGEIGLDGRLGQIAHLRFREGPAKDLPHSIRDPLPHALRQVGQLHGVFVVEPCQGGKPGKGERAGIHFTPPVRQDQRVRGAVAATAPRSRALPHRTAPRPSALHP
eukprot:NODE_1099_length_1180_cov_0.029602.p3 type:complete len:132 gc:universal NODE_1099_length_1180_cov_0.029602:706-1101(+)